MLRDGEDFDTVRPGVLQAKVLFGLNLSYVTWPLGSTRLGDGTTSVPQWVIDTILGVARQGPEQIAAPPTRTQKTDHTGSRSLAPLPPEVPQIPSDFVSRPDLIAAIKQNVLGGMGANATAVTAPSKRKASVKNLHAGASNTTATQGMGGVGKMTPSRS